MKKLTFLAAALLLCSSGYAQVSLYRAELTLQDSVLLPFFFIWDGSEGSTGHLRNGKEDILMRQVEPKGDSLVFEFPVFNNALHLLVSNDTETLQGYWVRYDAGNVRYPVRMTRGNFNRFLGEHSEGYPALVKEKYALTLESNEIEPTPAIGEFQRTGLQSFEGSILTESGDTRYLEGNVIGKELFLSTFDGIHAYVFKATISVDGSLKGHHFSGKKYARPFHGKPDAQAALRDPKTIATLSPSAQGTVAFSLPDWSTGQVVSLPEATKGQVTIVQIMGSWCPNCMDESRFFADLYREFSSKGLKIIGVAFEKTEDRLAAQTALGKCIRDLALPYPVLFAGKANAATIAKVFPTLEHFGGYPTSLVLDKKGRVRSIHTGFSGPSTTLYADYVKEQTALIHSLLTEK